MTTSRSLGQRYARRLLARLETPWPDASALSAQRLDAWQVLAELHALLKPDVYLEIGVESGRSLALSTSKTIGVDPAFAVSAAAVAGKPWLKLYRQTSDDFFRDRRVDEALEGGRLDLVFIDGLHRFEQVLRDFINVERWAAPASVIVLHDVIPPDVASASRLEKPGSWVGDVWKLVPCLARFRPELMTAVVLAPPSGLLVVLHPDPSNTRLADRYDAIVADTVTAGDETAREVADYLAGLRTIEPDDFLDALAEAAERARLTLAWAEGRRRHAEVLAAKAPFPR